MKYWSDKHRTLYNGNCRSMSELADNSIQCCVTSPPYWGLRKYAGEQESIWGGLPECSHEWVSKTIQEATPGDKPGHNSMVAKNRPNDTVNRPTIISNTCSLCGAWRGAYGLEPSPQMYVQHTVEILREIRRVLRKDGVVFWNVDDSYAGSGGPGSQYDNKATEKGKVFEKFENPNKNKSSNIKAKDLCLIPFRVAIAAQEDGWYVRSVIIWSKPNPMPESVTDRPTGSHEYILMLTKSAKYYWDMEAVREVATGYDGRHDTIMKPSGKYLDRNHMIDGANANSAHSRGCERWPSEIDGAPARNLRNVWTFPTQPYREAHFATFPEALPERCIKAGSKEGDTILDPFCGSGTTLEVAAKLNRHAVGYEISEEYCKLIVTRNNQSCLL